MIAIVNISKHYSKIKEQRYAVKVNHQTVAEFAHHPIDGLAVCLDRAAKAVREQSPDHIDPGLFAAALVKI